MHTRGYLNSLLVVALLAGACSDDSSTTTTGGASEALPADGNTDAPETTDSPETTEGTDTTTADSTSDTTVPDESDTTDAISETFDPIFPDPDWSLTDPAEVGYSASALAAFDEYAELTNSYCIAVFKDGRLIQETYTGEWDATTQQEIFSASKSVSSAVVGIAQDQGFLNIDEPASTYITEWVGTDSEDVTIRNLLSNDSGRFWSFDTDYVDLAVGSENRTEFAISLDQQHEPGAHWEYNNAAIQTLEAVVSRATGQDFGEYAAENLFTPLGMSSYYQPDPSGTSPTFMGVQSGCLDMGRFGHLFLQEGNWNGEQVVSADWVAESTVPSQDLNAAYGFLWWLNAQEGWILPGDSREMSVEPFWPDAPANAYAALGLGEQFIIVVPDEGLVITRVGPFQENLQSDTAPSPNELIRMALEAAEAGPDE